MTEIANRSKFHNHLLQTSLFNKDKIDLYNIPHSLKNMIMVQSTEKLLNYSPQKCTTRSDQKITTISPRELIDIKKKRMQAVYNRGFLSDPKEYYKPLGDPYIDTEMLLYDNLQLDVKGLFDSEQFAREAQEEITQQKKQQAKMKMRFKEGPKGHTNGFKYIKERLGKSNTRICSVKFGVPFANLCEGDSREHTYDTVKASPTENKQLDYNNLVIDEDRKTFFMNTYNKFLNSQRPEAWNETEKPSDQDQEQKKSNQIFKGAIKFSSKQIESALGIKREDHTQEITEKFFTSRDDFYEQRTRLNYRLTEELDRLDNIRRSNIQRKEKAFELSKKGHCLEDISAMRQKCSAEKRLERKQLLDNHPWYNELIKKVVVLNGVQRKITPPETVILDHLKMLIEDQIRFTKQTFFHLIRLLPTKYFMKDEVQRIFRFVKAHETISERDFLEVVELAGHGFVFQ